MPCKKNNKTFKKNLRKAVKHGLSESKALEVLTIIPKIMYTGDYKILFENNVGDLSLHTTKKDKSKFSGKLIIENDSLSLKNLSTISDNLNFTIESKSDSLKGVYRFSGRKENSIISGLVSLPSGETISWTATTFADSTDTEIKKNIESPSTPSRLAQHTFPNKAFGRLDVPDQENLHIKNITIWTSEDVGILEDYDLIIKNGLIDEIGQSLKTPSGYKIIDGTGKHLTAGMIDEHSHIAISGSVNECTDAITAEVRIGDVINPNDINIYRQLTGGVTTSHLLHGSCNANRWTSPN